MDKLKKLEAALVWIRKNAEWIKLYDRTAQLCKQCGRTRNIPDDEPCGIEMKRKGRYGCDLSWHTLHGKGETYIDAILDLYNRKCHSKNKIKLRRLVNGEAEEKELWP